MLKVERQVEIRVVYRSGYTHDFWVSKFSFKNDTYEWVSSDHRNKPLQFGGNDVAAVWQIGSRKRIVWSTK